jgi:hypothetical protein
MTVNADLPDGWESDKSNEFRKTFSDGTDVILSIVSAGEDFEVWCSAEHRVSGPSDAMICRSRNFKEAVSAAYKDMHEWNAELD